MMCERVQLPDGTAAIVCGGHARRRCACGRRAPLLCDWKVPARKSGTCDKPICAACALEPAPDKHLCPAHAEAYRQWQGRRRAVA